MSRRSCCSLALAAFVFSLRAQEIGFVERFALAEDRTVPLRELVPGSEDHYRWHVLDLQNRGRLEEADALLTDYLGKHPGAAAATVLLNRQRLLEFETQQARSLEHLTQTLGLHFDHQRERLPEEQDLATALAPTVVAHETLVRQALQAPALSGFQMDQPAAQDLLMGLELSPERRRELLNRLDWPLYPALADAVVQDLNWRGSGGFGSLRVHGMLLLEQLDRCAELQPDLLGNAAFVRAYLAKLQPPFASDWTNDPAEARAYFDRQWEFARRLPPSQNTLKALILYRRLQFDRSQNVRDRERFLTYARLPRQVPYISREFLRRLNPPGSDYADLNADLSRETLLPPIGGDEELVRDYLGVFLRDADSFAEFAPWFEEQYLRQVFAETKLLHGIGDAERWYGMLAPGAVQALRERVEVDFLPGNPRIFRVGDPVVLRLAVKNASQLMVRTYEINTVNWYLQNGEEISDSIDVDGLVSSDERTFDYTQPPIRRHEETFAFPALDRPGVWVIEFIGNGRSSRAVVRKGRLRLTERTGAAGHVFRVYDEDASPVPDAVLHFGGHAFPVDADGEATIPFSTTPGTQSLVVRRGDVAALHTFQHRPETYRLLAGFHLDPETLLPGEMAPLLVRPLLMADNTPASLTLLEDVALVVRTTDRKGVSTVQRLADFSPKPDGESLCRFRVPPDLRHVRVTLTAKVALAGPGPKVELSAEEQLAVGTTAAGSEPGILLVRPAAEGYWIELVGKGGEPLAGCPVSVTLQPRLFTRSVQATLGTDANGRIALGPLSGIAGIAAESPWASNRIGLELPAPVRRAPPVTGTAVADGEEVVLPLDDVAAAEIPIAIVEQRGGTLSREVRPEISRRDGLAALAGLPPGAYAVRYGRNPQTVAVAVLPGRRAREDIVAVERAGQSLPRRPLQIAAAAFANGTLTVRLANAGPEARVHVHAARFAQPRPAADALLVAPETPPLWHVDPQLPLRTISGRVLGDELRYVLERRHADIHAGNLLQRPSLLLNPWELRRTETDRQEAREGETWAQAARETPPPAPAAPEPRRQLGRERMAGRRLAESHPEPAPVPDFEFLPAAAVLTAGIRPGPDGSVRLDLGDIGGRQLLTIIACDGSQAVARALLLPGAVEAYRDLRLARSLDPAQGFGEVRVVDRLEPGQEVMIENASAARVQTYASLADVMALFESLGGNPHLAEFRFVLDWPELPPERRAELHGRYACHELHVFLKHKDPAYFAAVVAPFLANLKERSVVDRWLLGEDLSTYLQPWEWDRLNAFERAAVAKSLPEHAPAVRRAFSEVCALVRRDPAADLELFLRALQGRGAAAGFDGAASTVSALGIGRFQVLGFAGPAERADMAAGGMGMGIPAATAAPAPAMRAMRAPAAAAAGEAVLADALALVETEVVRKAAETDALRRTRMRRLYTAMDRTSEWGETRYWKVPLEQQSPDLVPVNRFWADWARHDGQRPFVSTHIAEAASSFAEMFLALALLDLPLRHDAVEPVQADAVLRLTSPVPAVCFRKELRTLPGGRTEDFLVRQEFVDPFAEPERTPYGERPRRFADPVPARQAVECRVVLANATPEPVHVDVLLQVPEGAVGVADAVRVESVPVALEAFAQTSLTYRFVFPRAGTFRHYPATVSRDGKVVAQAEGRTFTVVARPEMDTTTWDYVSQFGRDEEVLAFLERANLREVQPKLDRMAFRMRDRGFFTRALELLRREHCFAPVLWSYAVLHADPRALREFLPQTPLAGQVGPFLSSPILEIDAVSRGDMEHKEYWPLVNARAHVLGGERTILNRQFLEQYRLYLERLCHRAVMNDEDRLTACIYLLLQDRVGEALAHFARLDAARLEERLQADCLQAYLHFSQGNWQEAQAIAQRHRDYPVPRWRDRFREVLAHCDEIAGAAATVVDRENQAQVQLQLADTEPVLDLAVENRRVTIRHRHLAEVTVNYYLMDVELLFSRAPFVQDATGVFAVVRPNLTERRPLEAGLETTAFDLPEAVRNRNVVVEVTGAGLRRSQTYTPHSLDVQLVENYGQLRVAHAGERRPLPRTYVKVYARSADGQTAFYKDGYTDLRGRFDYGSLSTDDLDRVERFAILILSETAGALVREVPPPKR